jgi:hypothetical protein
VEVRDFLYNYTNIFFSEAVNETILVENWEETDFDHRYVEYASILVKIKDECFAPGVTDEKIIETLTHHKDHIVNLFNQKMKENFIDEFNKSGIDNKKADQFMPQNAFYSDRINCNVLKIFREFEESTLK